MEKILSQEPAWAKRSKGNSRSVTCTAIVFPHTVATLLVLVSFDFWTLISTGPFWRYLVVIGLLFLSAQRDASQATSNIRFDQVGCLFVFAFAIWHFIITADAIMSQQWEVNTLVIALGPFVAIAIILGAWTGTLTGRQSLGPSGLMSSYHLVGLGALFFASVALIDSLSASVGEPLSYLNHERTFIGIFVLTLPRIPFSRVTKPLVIVALAVSFVKYFSATSLILVPLALAVLYLISIRRSLRLPAVSAMLGGMVFFFFSDVERKLVDVYASVGRSNNSDTRVFLWEQGWDRISESLVLGGLSRLSITGYAQVSGVLAEVPFHNSYLAVMVVGGVVSFLLLLGSVVAVIAAVLNSPSRGDSQRARIWFPALACSLVAMSVNPVLDRLGVSLFFYGLLALAACSLCKKPVVLLESISIPKPTGLKSVQREDSN